MQEKPVEIVPLKSNYFLEKSDLSEAAVEPVDKEKEIDDAVDDMALKVSLKETIPTLIFIFLLFNLSLRY